MKVAYSVALMAFVTSVDAQGLRVRLCMNYGWHGMICKSAHRILIYLFTPSIGCRYRPQRIGICILLKLITDKKPDRINPRTYSRAVLQCHNT